MKKTILSLIILTLAFANSSVAQVSNAGVKFDFRNFQSGYFEDKSSLEKNLIRYNPEIFQLSDDGKYVLNYNNLKGSPYEVNDFSFGFVTDEQSNKSVNLFLRYNIFSDEVELRASLDKDDKMIALLKESDISCKIKGRLYRYASFLDENSLAKEGYLIQIYKGKHYSLYKRLKSVFTPKKISENGYAATIKAKFKRTTLYYIEKGDVISFLPNKKKILINKFNSKTLGMKRYLKNKKSTLKKEIDLIDLVKFLDASI